ncbi:SCF ubiquitin ligase [Spathaspora passalidarum NRRL Y-27907]|uniref:SCF ubiquitin ligase n=1 Tax=Spathaspora passalidarum (strain NRRL Y-27907 / 11-Y1) TaxID=619300 RepID=G3AR94_SPAPN|nr:SCF ubiquitin ligase [Spathaspora passalidarum NRRL Y-27907]EGW31269.1 SCF ubiquitin ligase [Spathaspora passalidarum NRRL Y-27907]
MSLPAYSDLNSTWNFIQPGLEFILGAQGDQGVTSKMYMHCYTAVYNYCVNKSRKSDAGSSLASSYAPNADNNSYSLAGAEIYSKLETYLTQFIKGLKKEPHESLLEFYVRKWTRFTIGAVYMNNVFDYMNRYWVQKERSDGRRDIYDVNTLSLIKWRNEMFQPNSDVLIKEILDLIEKQRNNMIVDTSLISTAIKSLVFLSIDANDLKKPNLVIYVNSFEKPFLKATEEYYSRESSKFLAEHNVVDYMKKCEARLSQEISRSNNYLEEHTKNPLLDTLNNALIKNHAQEMYDQFLILLEQNQIEHIQRMYKLLYKVPDTLVHLADTLEEYIKREAGKTLEEIKVQAESQAATAASTEGTPGVNGAPTRSRRSAGSGVAIDYKTYINTLIAIYNQFNDVVIKAFSKDTRFIRSLDNACRHFVNKNPIATPTTRSNCKTPELLAKYADGFLKSTSKEADILDMNADNLMIVFKFINDKDAFEEHYRRSLAKRLINGTCKSDELEESIIHRLQEENSIEYTSKMTKMFSDMKASEDLKADVRNHVGENLVKEFNPLILAQSMWPFKYLDDYNLNVPSELQAPFEKVIEIYGSKHSGRQLKWLWNHGRAELKANLSRKGKPPFLFTVSNVQLMILIAFNKKNSYTFKELHGIVGTSRNIFEAHLLPFTKYKLMDQSPPSSGPNAGFNDDTVLTIVEEYKSKKLKVNFISNIKTNEPKQEEDEANKEIDEARKNFLSACIVRIMKSRKVCKHNDLINEVMPQTLSRFRAKPLDVKRVIDQLIEKKYIKRIEDNCYEYMT